MEPEKPPAFIGGMAPYETLCGNHLGHHRPCAQLDADAPVHRIGYSGERGKRSGITVENIGDVHFFPRTLFVQTKAFSYTLHRNGGSDILKKAGIFRPAQRPAIRR
jgi:hypothetical protein